MGVGVGEGGGEQLDQGRPPLTPRHVGHKTQVGLSLFEIDFTSDFLSNELNFEISRQISIEIEDKR